jgi:hypothetical protein
MTTATEKDVVIFRVDDEGTAYPLFPYLEGSSGCCTAYQHIGQHCSADYQLCIQTSRPAKQSEYKELATELRRIGYKLTIRKRRAARRRR